MNDAGELADEESDEERDDEGDEDGSDESSVQSVPVSVSDPSVAVSDSPAPSRIPQPTPELITDTELPFLSSNVGQKKDRRGSGTSGHSSSDKIRSVLQRKSLHSEEKETQKEKEKRGPPARVTKSHGNGGKKGRKARQAAQQPMKPPETKAVDELRPLFVEMVSGFSLVRERRSADCSIGQAVVEGQTIAAETTRCGAISSHHLGRRVSSVVIQYMSVTCLCVWAASLFGIKGW